MHRCFQRGRRWEKIELILGRYNGRVIDGKVLLGGFCGAGGLTVAVKRLALGLNSRGEDIEVVLKVEKEGDDTLVRRELEEAGIRVWTLNHGVAPRPSNYFRRVGEMKSVIEKVNPEVVNFHYGGIFPWGSEFLAARLAGVKRIYGSHHGWISDPAFRPKLQQKLDSRLALRLGSGFVFLLDEQRDCFVKHIGRHSETRKILNGIQVPLTVVDQEFAQQQLELPTDRFLLLFVGRIDGLKGVADLIRACAGSDEFRRKGFLVLAGDGDHRAEYEALAEELIPGQHRFLGYRIDLNIIFAAAHVCTLLSHHETFALAYLEAGAYGLASLSYDIPSVRDVVLNGVTGFQVNKHDIEGASAALDRIIGNPDATREMGVNARKLVSSQFSLDQTVDDYIDLFKPSL